MEYHYATVGQVPGIANLHPELHENRPDLCHPKFADLPVSADPDFPFIFYAVEDGRIVGSRRAFPDRLVFKGAEYPWAWCFDTVVDVSQHGKGIGSELVRLQVDAFDRLGVISGAAFSAPAMMRIYEKLGYQVLEFTPRMTLVRNARPFVAKAITNRTLSRIFGAAASIALRIPIFLACGRRAGKACSSMVIEQSEFGELFDAHDGYAEQPRAWASDARWVLARMQSNDVCFKVVDKASAEPLALAVIRSSIDQANQGLGATRLSVMYFKFLRHARDAAGGMSLSLIRELFKAKCDVADVITSSPSLTSVLKAHGFRKRGTGMTFVYKVPTGMQFDGGRDIGDWHLTHFCSDGFSFT